jgi:hypothetical protein
MNQSVIRQIVELEYKSALEMREIYNNLMPKKCSTNANKEFLKPRIAYRLQELTFGGLSEEAKEKLEKIANGISTSNFRKHSDLLPGTKICREWNGFMHEVEVLKECFEYQGQKFKSLSAIANRITGTKWNGPKFFKLYS